MPAPEDDDDDGEEKEEKEVDGEDALVPDQRSPEENAPVLEPPAVADHELDWNCCWRKAKPEGTSSPLPAPASDPGAFHRRSRI